MSEALAISGPGLFVPDQFMADLSVALRCLEAERRRNGLPWSSDLEQLRAAVTATAQRRLARVPQQVPPGTASDLPIRSEAPGKGGTGRIMTAMDVSLSVGVTPRRVRKLAQIGQLPGRRTPDGWEFDEKDVQRWMRARSRA